MKTIASTFLLCFLLISTSMNAQQFEKDSFVTKRGQLDITFIKHGSLLFTYNGNTIYIDPVSDYADYSKLPKADVILITHEHSDHFDTTAIANIKKESTIVVANPTVHEKLGEGIAMKNGDEQRLTPYLYVKAVPAYNIERKQSKPNSPSGISITDALTGEVQAVKVSPEERQPQQIIYHPRGNGNGYLLTIDDKRIYIAGDTEDIDEMRDLKDIDIAFLPINQPYTMTPKQAANAALMFNPTILYPYHYGATRLQELVDLLYYDKNIEVRIRQLQ